MITLLVLYFIDTSWWRFIKGTADRRHFYSEPNVVNRWVVRPECCRWNIFNYSCTCMQNGLLLKNVIILTANSHTRLVWTVSTPFLVHIPCSFNIPQLYSTLFDNSKSFDRDLTCLRYLKGSFQPTSPDNNKKKTFVWPT